MSTLILIIREFVALFIDDGSLAIAIIVVVALAGMFAGVDAPPLITGCVLFLGCLIVLLENVFRATRKHGRTRRPH